MLKYALRRIILILPTVGLILILAFLLQSYSSKDEVASLITLEGERGYNSRASYMEAYSRHAKKLGYDQPIFYFSIGPAFIPEEINEIFPRTRNSSLRSILKETKDTEGALTLYRSIDEVLLKKESVVDVEIVKVLSRIENVDELKELKLLGGQLKGLLRESNSIDPQLLQISTMISDLNYDPSWVLPKISWHGRSNRFHMWLSNGLQYGGGVSLTDGSPASAKVYRAMKWTFALSLITLIVIALGSLILSLFQVHIRDSFLDRLITAKLYAFYTMPLFWIASIMVVFFTTAEYGAWTNIFPSVGIKRSYGGDTSFFTQLFNNSSRLILPVLCLSLHSLAYITKQLKEEMIDTLKSPFVLAARARGLSELQILRDHVLPNSLISYVTLISGGLASLFTGSVIIEVIFNIPGLGRLLLDSMNNNDWPVIFIILILVAFATMVGYLIGDIMLAYLSPKVRSEMEKS